MSEVKKDTQVEPTVPTEKVEPEKLEPQEPTVEGLTQEIERKEGEIQRLQGITRDLQRRGVPKEAIDALHTKIDGLQEWVATVMDDLANRIGGEYEEPKPSRKSYSEQLKERKTQEKPPPAQPTDPEVMKFVKYVDSQGLDYDDSLVQEAVAEDRTPQEALKYLKDKVKNQSQTEIDKRAEDKAKLIVEQKLKEMGITATGPLGPSAPARSWQDLSPDEKIRHAVSK